LHNLTIEQLTFGLVLAGILQIVAILLSPLVVLWIQKKIEDRQNKVARRVYIFKTLMATRSAKLSLEHVQALNSIDVEFYDSEAKCKAVIDAWEEYREYLSPVTEQQAVERTQPERDNLFSALMAAMANCLGYQFKRSDLRRSAYAPRFHVDTEAEWALLRRALIRVTEKGYVPVAEISDQLPHTLNEPKPYATNPGHLSDSQAPKGLFEQEVDSQPESPMT
jgi:hypothetical protein